MLRYIALWLIVTHWNIRWYLRTYVVNGLRDRHDRNHTSPLESCPDSGCVELRSIAQQYKRERDRGLGPLHITRRSA